jgi:putative DNA primase/helicase
MNGVEVNPDGIPDVLKERDQWVAWHVACRQCYSNHGLGAEECTTEGCDGEPSKVPLSPTNGRNASSTTPVDWGTFDEALEYHDREDTHSHGVGFMFDPEGMVVGLDLDNVRDPDSGELEPWAKDLVDRLDSFTEISASGTGLHIFVLGIKPGDACRRGQESTLDRFEKAELEVYEESRYFAMTGERLEDTPATVEERNGTLSEVYDELLTDGADEEQKSLDEATEPTATADLDDADLVEKAMNADNGDKFRDLWNGRTTGYESHSEADLALCNLLAFWTGGDRSRIDDLFRESGLSREKWTEREDYRNRTIDKALRGRTDYYDPQAQASAAGSDGGVSVDLGADVDQTESFAWTLEPSTIRAFVGLDADDGEEIADLDDREKAAAVWEVLRRSNQYHVRVKRDTDQLWTYDGGVWVPEGERVLRHAARAALGPSNYGGNTLAELKAQARADPSAEVEPDRFGLDPGQLAVENGLLNLEAAADGDDDGIRSLKPSDYALTRLPVEYDPEAEYADWQAHVEEWAEDGKADALQEYVGYCLHVGDLPIHRALLLVGSGANGKGTFLHVVRALLGDGDNTTSIELQTLANERDALAEFYGALANIDDDLSARKLGAGLGMFKKLVGGDRVRARRLYEDGFEFDATGKHLYAANTVPQVDVADEDEAFWRRWLLVEFPNHYPPGERDPHLRDDLSEPEALSGVLNWAIEGWGRLMDQQRFTGEERYAAEKRSRWQSWGDSADKFIEDCLERDEDAENVDTGSVHRRYAAWCRENNHDPVGQQALTNRLKKESFDYGRKRVDGTPTRGFAAMGFADEVPDLDDTPERDDRQATF